MNKERLLAARQKLKEFQRSKKEQERENAANYSDPNNHNIDQNITLKDTPVYHQDDIPVYHQDNVQHSENNFVLKENDGIIRLETNIDEHSNAFNNENHVERKIPVTQDNISFQNLSSYHESTNGIIEIPSNTHFIPNHSRNESSSTVSSQIFHENGDQNLSTQQLEQPNSDISILSNPSSYLQKEHLLQMANAVANVLVDEKNFDESSLNNCDLEQRNQFLNCCLEEQKKLVNQLHIQVGQCNSRISELEAIISTKDAEFDNRLIREVNPLKEQIKIDAQTIGLLVGEKEELTATNTQCQHLLKQKTEEVIELSSRFRTFQQQFGDLERELTSTKNNLDEVVKSFQELQKKYEEEVEKSSKLKKAYEDFELEKSEILQKLNYKNSEITNLQQELSEKMALLSLSEIKIQQLTNSPQEVNSLETQHHAAKALEQQLSQMREAFESVTGEKDEISKKYQSYVQQLDERYTKLLAELEVTKKTLVETEIREQSYIQRLSDLEQQLQREKDKPVKPMEDHSEKIATLTKSMDNLVLEQENIQSLLNEKDSEIELLKKELAELQDFREQSVEASKLVTALQSEQLGASRAVSQNQQLKTQLDEMHDAFIALSNTKLDLTEQLQAERAIGRKLNSQLNQIEQQLDDLKEQLTRKEEALAELQKEKLHTAQIEDQIQHYQAQSHSATTLQQELQKALYTIDNLKKENQLLQSKLDTLQHDSITNIEVAEKSNQTLSEITENITSNTEEHFVDKTDNIESLNKRTVINLQNDVPTVSEPMKKLEFRFKETMERVAELTDEKQRLEHLVLQLQGETETIGEYVTLYQKQRLILQEKAREKENTFKLLLEQRNQQQEQLHKLKVLVAELLKSKNSNTVVTTATAVEENMSLSENSVGESESNNIEVIEGHVNKLDDTIQQADKTTSQILDLLTEIKDCNNSCILEPNFHPCPWCSGKLITV